MGNMTKKPEELHIGECLDLLNDGRCKLMALSVMLTRLLEDGSAPCGAIIVGIGEFF